MKSQKATKKQELAKKGPDPIIELQNQEHQLQSRLLQEERLLLLREADRVEAHHETMRRLQRECLEVEEEDAKVVAKGDQARRNVASAHRAVQLLQDDIAAQERKIEQIRNERKKLAHNKEKPENELTQDKSGKDTVSEADLSGIEPGDAGDKAKLIAAVEEAEARVLQLRTRYTNARNAVSEATTSFAEVGAEYDMKLKRLRELQQLNSEYFTMKANVHAQQAKATTEEFTTTNATLQSLEKELEEAINEKQLMLQHLLQGVRQRHDTLKELRSRFLALPGSEIYRDILKENVEQRDNLVTLYISLDSEMLALQNYVEVLRRRCETSADRVHSLSFDLELLRLQQATR
jgi:hypothetical protein